MALSKIDGTNFIAPTIPVASGGTGSATLAGAGLVNTPAFLVKLTSNYNIATSTSTKIQYTTKVFDTDNAFDNSTNYRFTVPSGKAGKYYFYATARANNFNANRFVSFIAINNADTATAETGTASGSAFSTLNSNIVLDLDVGDYVEHQVFHNQGGTQPIMGNSSEHQSMTFFGGYKIIGA